MTATEMRIYRLEGLVLALQQSLTKLQTQLGQISQNQFAAIAPLQSGGSAAGTYLAYPNVSIASGYAASLVVQQVAAGSINPLGSYLVYNYGNSGTVSGDGSSTYPVYVLPDGAGGFTIYNQTCA